MKRIFAAVAFVALVTAEFSALSLSIPNDAYAFRRVAGPTARPVARAPVARHGARGPHAGRAGVGNVGIRR
jgi:hypothetical protein